MTEAAAHAKTLDRTGIAASLLCAAHCVAGLFLAGMVGVPSVFSDENTELTFFVVAAILALVATIRGYSRHRNTRPAVLSILGLAVLLGARTVEFDAEIGEVSLSVLGAALLVGAHALNLRFLKQHDGCCVERGVPSLSTQQ